jgi:hypothetical protein
MINISNIQIFCEKFILGKNRFGEHIYHLYRDFAGEELIEIFCEELILNKKQVL